MQQAQEWYRIVDSQVALSQMLGGGRTLLVDDRKAEAMLGVRKCPGNDSMPAPDSRLIMKARQDPPCCHMTANVSIACTLLVR